MATSKPNPLLEFAATAAASASLAQAEQLTGIPFYQQHQARQDKKATATEDLTANRARLQAALSTKLIDQSSIDAYPGGFEAFAKSKDFNTNLQQGISSTELTRRETGDAKSALEEAELIWASAGVPANRGKPTDPHEMKLVATQFLREEGDKARQKTKGSDIIKGFSDLASSVTASDKLGQSDLDSLRLRALQDEETIRGLDIPADDKARFSAQLQADAIRAEQIVVAAIRANEAEAMVQTGDYSALTGKSGTEFTKLMNKPGISQAVGARRTELLDMSTIAHDDALMRTMRAEAGDDVDILKFLDLAEKVKGQGDWTVEQIANSNPEFLKEMEGINWTTIKNSQAHGRFVQDTLTPAQVDFQQQLDASPDFVNQILFNGATPSAADLIREGTDGPGKFKVTGADDPYKDFRNRFSNNEVPEADLRTIQTMLRYGGLGQSSPMLMDLQGPIEARLLKDVKDGLELPAEATDLDELDRLNGTVLMVEQQLENALGQQALDAFNLEAQTETVAFDINRPGLRPRQVAKRRELTERLKTDTFVESYANLTRSDDTGKTAAEITKLRSDMNTDDPVLRGSLQNALTLKEIEQKHIIKRTVFGPPIRSLVQSLASPKGYAGLEEAVMPFLTSTGGGGTALPVFSPSSQAILDVIAEFEGTTSIAARETLLDDFIVLLAPLVAASDPRARDAGLTTSDVAAMWSEQQAVYSSRSMQSSITQLSQGPFDTIPADGWNTTHPELRAYQVMNEMEHQN